jgi:hypothetical protein
MWFSETICEDKDSSNLKMEAAGSSETLLPIYQSTLRHIPEDRNPNLKYLEEKNVLLWIGTNGSQVTRFELYITRLPMLERPTTY